ncbi:MAG: ATP12 family chaperone protein [Parvularculaceae bacterium]
MSDDSRASNLARFYECVDIAPADAGEGGGAGFVIMLDGRPARTPARRRLAAPTRAAAELAAEEWRAQGERIDLRSMVATRLLTTAIDRGREHGAAWRAELVNYLPSDLVRCHASSPRELVARQAAAWDPLLAWMEAEYGVRLTSTDSLRPAAPDPDELARLARRLETESDFVAIGLKSAAELTGSAVIALALGACAFDAETLFAASRIEEAYQQERWGVDAEAERRTERMKGEFLTLAAYLAALSP